MLCHTYISKELKTTVTYRLHTAFFACQYLIFNYQNHTTTSFFHNKLHWMGLLHGFKNATAFYNSSYLDLDTWC